MTPRYWIVTLAVAIACVASAFAQNASRSPNDAPSARKSAPAAKKNVASDSAKAPIEMVPDSSSTARTPKTSQDGDLVLLSASSNSAPKKKSSDNSASRNQNSSSNNSSTPPAQPRPAPPAEHNHADHNKPAEGKATPPPHQQASNSWGPSAGTTQVYFPSGEKISSAVLLERINPTEVRVGEPYSYEIKLTNLSATMLTDLQLTETIASTFDLTGSAPEGGSGPTLQWNLGNLNAHESKSVSVSGAAKSTGELKSCANVTFHTGICSSLKAVQPGLTITQALTPQVIICDPITLKLSINNPGSGVAKNVRITDTLPSGLVTTDGQTQLVFPVGDLGAGQSRDFTVALKATATGSFENSASVNEDGGLSAQASAQVRVSKPELVVTKTGPELRYLGRPAQYEITVTNNGDAPANDCVLVDDMPTGVSFVDASSGGSLVENKVEWKLGAIAPGATQKVNMTLKPTAKGTVKNTVSAKAYCTEATASTTMKVIGIPAILLEVVDMEDPIEVGANCTYEIIVTNQGSAEGTNINIVCTLPPEEEYISAVGPTASTLSERTITFAPLAKLPERTKATYRVTVKGIGTGDVRFHTSLTSDQTTSPVDETESTHIYK